VLGETAIAPGDAPPAPSAQAAGPGLLEGELPSIVKRAPRGPACPPVLLMLLSAILCGAGGVAASLGKPGQETVRSDEAIFGAILGGIIGIALAIDHRFFLQRLNTPVHVPIEGESPRAPRRPSEWIAVAMLVIPVLSALLTWFAADLR
jgi:hypothetical protein